MVSKLFLTILRQKVQQVKDPDIIKYIHSVEDVVEEHSTFNKKDAELALIPLLKLEDMMVGAVK